MSDEYIDQVSERYIELYEKITGEIFEKTDILQIRKRIEKNINLFLQSL
jgi:phosphoribosylaminoimidazole-succinocarboxamide synthase